MTWEATEVLRQRKNNRQEDRQIDRQQKGTDFRKAKKKQEIQLVQFQ